MLINPNRQPTDRYHLVLNKPGINPEILPFDIVEVEGNDTVLLAMCKSYYDQYVCYKIKHVMGKQIISTDAISNLSYDSMAKAIKPNYRFQSDD